MQKFGKIFSALIIFFSISLLIYILYRSKITYEGLNNTYYNKYYFIFSFFLLFGIINFKLNPKVSNKFSAIIVSIFLALYSFELLLYFKNTSSALKTKEYKKKLELMKKKDPDYDTRTRLEVYLDEKKKNPNVVVLPVPITLASQNKKELLHFSGHSNIKTVFCNELGFYIIYKSDRYGFRNPDKEWDKKEIEYLIVGDSLGQGMCVNEEDTISGWLRNNLKNKNSSGVINLSMWGNGPLIMYSSLREYLELKNVKNILWLHSEGNDFTDITFEQKSEIINNYLNDRNFSQNLPKRQNEINEFVLSQIKNRQIEGQTPDTYIKKFGFEDLKQIVKLTYTRKETLDKNFFNKRKQPLLENLEMYKKIIIKTNQLSNDNGSNFYFINLPDHWARSNPEQPNLMWKEKVIATNEIREFLKKNNIAFIDIYETVFKNHNDVLSLFPYRGFGHFNDKGYRLTAQSISEQLKTFEKGN